MSVTGEFQRYLASTVEHLGKAGVVAEVLDLDAGLAQYQTDSWLPVAAQIAEEHDRLDILVTTANRGHRGTLLQTGPDELDAMLDANVKSVFHAMQAALPRMLEAGGAIVGSAQQKAPRTGSYQSFQPLCPQAPPFT